MSITTEQIKQIRDQFPSLKRMENGEPAIFFDGPAGTQVPQRVIDGISDYLIHCNANHEGLFGTSVQSDELLHEAHQAFADFVNANHADEISFGQNMTSLTFALSRSISKNWKPGDEIIVTRLDHDANISPWVLAAEDAGVTVHYVPFKQDDYTLDTDHLYSLLSDKTQLVAVGCASNATGGINPVKEICAKAKEVNALTFLDAVHFGPHGLIDVQEFGCDFLACSAYKFFGPHVGILWGREELMSSLKAYKVRPASDAIPGKWMTGTQNHECIAGALQSVDYLADLGRTISGNQQLKRRGALEVAFSAINSYEQHLGKYMTERLLGIPGLKIWGIDDVDRVSQRFPTFSITINGVKTTDIARDLAGRGIYVWHGNYYALQFTESCGLEPEGMVRIGLVHYNTTEEVDRLIRELVVIASPQLA